MPPTNLKALSNIVPLLPVCKTTSIFSNLLKWSCRSLFKPSVLFTCFFLVSCFIKYSLLSFNCLVGLHFTHVKTKSPNSVSAQCNIWSLLFSTTSSGMDLEETLYSSTSNPNRRAYPSFTPFSFLFSNTMQFLAMQFTPLCPSTVQGHLTSVRGTMHNVEYIPNQDTVFSLLIPEDEAY